MYTVYLNLPSRNPAPIAEIPFEAHVLVDDLHWPRSIDMDAVDSAITSANRGVEVIHFCMDEAVWFRLRRRVLEGAIAPDLVNVLLWDEDTYTLRRLNIDTNGWVDGLPQHLFDAAINECEIITRLIIERCGRHNGEDT